MDISAVSGVIGGLSSRFLLGALSFLINAGGRDIECKLIGGFGRLILEGGIDRYRLSLRHTLHHYFVPPLSRSRRTTSRAPERRHYRHGVLAII
jgi:hypothetical protein